MTKNIKKAISVAVMFVIAVSFIGLAGSKTYAASKKPDAPRITSAKEISNRSDDDKIIVVKWEKAKNAKKYQVALRDKKWVKVKTVKKTEANKKKFTKKNKYKVKAKGNKYTVYQYKSKYSILETTKGRSCRFFQTPDEDYLKPDTKYTIAVRSVNGSKHSAWEKVTVKTSEACWAEKTLTKTGEKLSLTVNGNDFTPTVGKAFAVPAPAPKKGTIEANPVTIIPNRINYTVEREPDPKDDYYDIGVEGKTPDGRDANLRLTIENGDCDSIRYTISNPKTNIDSKYSVEALGYGPGYIGEKYTVNDPKVTVVWTTDGTAPKLGQESKSISASEYPFAAATCGGTIQVRGTADYENISRIWGEMRCPAYFSYCTWIRIYDGNTLNYESFEYYGYDY